MNYDVIINKEAVDNLKRMEPFPAAAFTVVPDVATAIRVADGVFMMTMASDRRELTTVIARDKLALAYYHLDAHKRMKLSKREEDWLDFGDSLM